MTLTASTMPKLGTPAPDFSLPDIGNHIVSLRNFDASPALLVVFLSHHCPYTRHIFSNLAEMIRDYQSRGVAVVGINSNDPEQHVEDRPEKMAQLAEKQNFPFPYLKDATQEIAKAYKAACTPDFFLYDQNRKLVYRGRFDDARPDRDVPVSGNQLRAAMEALLSGKEPIEPQKPSVGCNIKWKPGNEPEYFREAQTEHA
ncbi:MAG: thioredoxin family protein [Gammaproteobacteria bacterium]|jgi:peroxiredoxin